IALVRVRYRLANKSGGRELHDVLFTVHNAKVIPFAKNVWGDDWRACLRREVEAIAKFRERLRETFRPSQAPLPQSKPGAEQPRASTQAPAEKQPELSKLEVTV